MEQGKKRFKVRWSDGHLSTLIFFELTCNWKIEGQKREFHTLNDLENYYKSKVKFL